MIFTVWRCKHFLMDLSVISFSPGFAFSSTHFVCLPVEIIAADERWII